MTKLDRNKTALVSVDNTRAFQDPELWEMPVEWWEQAAKWTYQLIQQFGDRILALINTTEEHPQGHISFASSLEGKQPFDGELKDVNTVRWEEVRNRDEQNHWISKSAGFNLQQLKQYLQEVEMQVLWPDHSVEGTEWTQLIPPLKENLFDKKFIKWTKPYKESYSAFEDTWLHKHLEQLGVSNVVIWWLVTEVCVNATAMDSLRLWFNTLVVQDAIKWLSNEGHQQYIEQMEKEWIKVVTIDQLKNLIN